MASGNKFFFFQFCSNDFTWIIWIFFGMFFRIKIYIFRSYARGMFFFFNLFYSFAVGCCIFFCCAIIFISLFMHRCFVIFFHAFNFSPLPPPNQKKHPTIFWERGKNCGDFFCCCVCSTICIFMDLFIYKHITTTWKKHKKEVHFARFLICNNWLLYKCKIITMHYSIKCWIKYISIHTQELFDWSCIYFFGLLHQKEAFKNIFLSTLFIQNIVWRLCRLF